MSSLRDVNVQQGGRTSNPKDFDEKIYYYFKEIIQRGYDTWERWSNEKSIFVN